METIPEGLTIESLPYEILELILDWGNELDLIFSSRVCHGWRTAVAAVFKLRGFGHEPGQGVNTSRKAIIFHAVRLDYPQFINLGSIHDKLLLRLLKYAGFHGSVAIVNHICRYITWPGNQNMVKTFLYNSTPECVKALFEHGYRLTWKARFLDRIKHSDVIRIVHEYTPLSQRDLQACMDEVMKNQYLRPVSEELIEWIFSQINLPNIKCTLIAVQSGDYNSFVETLEKLGDEALGVIYCLLDSASELVKTQIITWWIERGLLNLESTCYFAARCGSIALAQYCTAHLHWACTLNCDATLVLLIALKNKKYDFAQWYINTICSANKLAEEHCFAALGHLPTLQLLVAKGAPMGEIGQDLRGANLETIRWLIANNYMTDKAIVVMALFGNTEFRYLIDQKKSCLTPIEEKSLFRAAVNCRRLEDFKTLIRHLNGLDKELIKMIIDHRLNRFIRYLRGTRFAHFLNEAALKYAFDTRADKIGRIIWEHMRTHLSEK
jgi:hypothetical protein